MAKITKELSDQQLLDAFSEGNALAYNTLFHRYFKRIYGFTFSLLDDAETARELAMDVMMRLWQKEGKIDAENGLKPYLFRSVRNAVYNHLRKNKIITEPIEDFYEHADLADGCAADSLQLYKELGDLYAEKLGQLSPQRRKIFEFSRNEDLSYTEIAQKMNLSTHTVRNQMSATLKYFRKQMKAYSEAFIFLMIIYLF